MRSSITLKLFLAILATCIVVALAMGVAVRVSFDSGFDDYVQEREQQRLDTLAQLLAADYAEFGGWQFLSDRRDHWWRSLRLSRRDLSDRRGHDGGPPLRVTLIDGQGDWLAGPRVRPAADMRRVPVVALGQTVGWLLTPPFMPRVVSDDIDEQFQSRQLRATWVIVGLSVLLAALVSLLLARILLVPVRRLAQATHRLASGDYQARVRVGAPDELGRLARDFNRLAHNLARHEQWRRELMADVSHELRTPLAVLRGEIEALQDGLRPLDQAALASLVHEVKQLSDLIDDLYELSLADVGALNYHLEAVDLESIVTQAVDAVRDRFERHGLALDVHVTPGLMLQGDARRLSQLVGNLLENSLRYTDSPGQVRVRAGRQGGDVLLEIADTAPGVAPEHLSRLFERLYRAEASRSRQYGGAGLGLAICRRIVEAHGGQISASAADLGGLAIQMRWPANGITEGIA
ncbi:sensor histidine kinase efflux regulator BaeS [Castellaniella sp.]|uniref:sensor histidine kinase efflux regulator BaeS n=1 Tax=Castellaniella sp. TaxID=1955812 RepID=UPI002B00275C|nr:sensor histidine kinase efflux regulator BaeS [Castellaniella sp.]